MWTKLDEEIENSIALGFPSGQIVVQLKGEVVKRENYGYSSRLPLVHLAKNNTLYDIASLTKIFSVTYIFQFLVSRDLVTLDTPITEFFDAKKISQDKRSITLRMLLMHQAGFEPNPLFYDENYSKTLYCQERHEFADKLLLAPLIHKPNTTALYSDVDYMLITFIIEKIVGQRLDKWLEEVFWNPLGLTHIGYAPLKRNVPKEMVAATELHGNTRDGVVSFTNIRTAPIWGEVQDEKAYHCMKGYSGHAGLFANVDDLLVLLNLMRIQSDYFSEKTKTLFLQPSKIDSTYGLGWRLNQGGMQFMFGDYASSLAYGHTGWTGCVMFHDPKYDLSVIYLTNRKHTAVIHPQENPNLFYGDTLPAGKYRTIVNHVYEALELS